MYSRMRYEKEREYIVPPRYDGNAFRMYNQSDRLTTGADEVKAAWKKHGDAERSSDPSGSITPDMPSKAGRSPFTVDEPPYSPDDIADTDESETYDAGKADGSDANVLNTGTDNENDTDRPADAALVIPPHKRSPLDALSSVLGRFSYEDALIGAIILVLAGENGSGGNGECSSVILALIILLALK